MNVLTSALNFWTEQTQNAKQAQKTAMDATSIDAFLSQQASGLKNITEIQNRTVDDVFLQSALKCLPHEDIPSKHELSNHLGILRQKLEAFALMPSSGGGLLTQLVANLGSRLKIKVNI